MKYIATILLIVFGVIYIPINRLYLAVQKWHFGMKKKDKVVFYAFAPFYWILVVITYIISAPYEFISKFASH